MDKDLATSQQNQPINDKPKRKCTAARPNGRALVSDEPRLKRACTEKQLAALRAGREKNSRFKPKSATRPDGQAAHSDAFK